MLKVFKLEEIKELSYKQLQLEIKAIREQGIAVPKLNSKKEVLIDFLMGFVKEEAEEIVALTIKEQYDLLKNEYLGAYEGVLYDLIQKHYYLDKEEYLVFHPFDLDRNMGYSNYIYLENNLPELFDRSWIDMHFEGIKIYDTIPKNIFVKFIEYLSTLTDTHLLNENHYFCLIEDLALDYLRNDLENVISEINKHYEKIDYYFDFYYFDIEFNRYIVDQVIEKLCLDYIVDNNIELIDHEGISCWDVGCENLANYCIDCFESKEPSKLIIDSGLSVVERSEKLSQRLEELKPTVEELFKSPDMKDEFLTLKINIYTLEACITPTSTTDYGYEYLTIDFELIDFFEQDGFISEVCLIINNNLPMIDL